MKKSSQRAQRWVGGVGVICAAAACGPVHYAKYTPLSGQAARAARAPDQVELYFSSQEPTCPHRVVGLYQSGRRIPMTINGQATPELAPIREDAAKRGLDGVRDLECAVDNGNCSGRAFVCEG